MARNLVTPKGRATQVQGIPELAANVNAILTASSGPLLKHEVFLPPARIIRDLAKVGAKWQHVKSALYISFGKATEPNVLVGVNYKKAFDAHWLEYGTPKNDRRRPKEARLLKFVIGGRTIFSKSVANLSPKPFMRPAVTNGRGTAIALLADGFKKFIQKYGDNA